MSYEGGWARAQAVASQAVDSLAVGDRGSLILFATAADAAVRSSSDRSRLQAAIAEAAPGSDATQYGPALRLAQSILSASTLPRRELILVSDFQRNGWNRDAAPRLPDDTTVMPVSVATEQVVNVGITAVTLQRGSFSGQERIGVTAALVNHSSQGVGDLSISLDIDGRTVASERTDLDPQGSASVSFSPFTLSAERVRGTVRIGADALAADNAFHFVASRARAVPVLLADQGTPGASLYLSQALEIGTAPRFSLRRGSVGQFTDDELTAGAVLILNDVVPSASELTRLRSAVERGAGLLVIAGERADWSGVTTDLLPGMPTTIVDRAASRAGLLATIELDHALFEPFRTPRSGQFSSARFFRYRSLALTETAEIIARFDDGAAALAEHRLGQGRAVVWASTLNTLWNDLAIKPLFLPFAHRLVTHLAQHVEPPAWMTVGQVVDPNASQT